MTKCSISLLLRNAQRPTNKFVIFPFLCHQYKTPTPIYYLPNIRG